MLWIRWALSRLEALIAGSAPALARDLLEGTIFRKGELAQRLVAADLRNLDVPSLRALGIAVAHRAMSNTFVVQDDGVEACAANPSLDEWPAAYRAGLAEGLMLDRNGYVNTNTWAAQHIPLVLAAHPDAASVLQVLRDKIQAADWAYVYAGDPDLRAAVAGALAPASAVLSTAEAQGVVGEIISLLVDRATANQE